MSETRKNIFNYLDYRVFLNNELFYRINKNQNYSLRAYSRDLGVSVGFLSELLRGQKKVSLQKGRLLFTKFNLNADEFNYAMKLVQYQKSENELEKTNIFNEIWALYNKGGLQEKDMPELNAAHVIVYGLIRRINEKSLLYKTCQKVGLTEKQISLAIQDLQKVNHIHISNDQIFINDEKLTFSSKQNILPAISDFSNLVVGTIMKTGGMAPPNRVAQAFILALDQKSYELAIETHKHYLKSLFKISSSGKKIKKIVYISDFLLAQDLD